MSEKTATSLFMFSPLSSRYAGFYQQLLRGLGSYQQLGNKLVQMAEQAHAFRQFDEVNEIGQLLSNLPIEDYQAIGYYYLAVAFNRCGSGDMDKAKNLFELAADTAPPMYRAKAILSLAAVSAHKKDTDSELYYFVESLKASGDFSARIVALRGIAVHKAREGYHKQALNDLERTLPLAKYAPPHIYFDYLNAVAVELWEAGRKQEARNIIKYVLASPFIQFYPEWQETANDLREPNRSFVAIPSVTREPVRVEKTEIHHASKPVKETKPKKPASVLAFRPLKEAPEPKKPDKLSPKEINSLSTEQKRELVLAAIRTGTFTPFDYDKFLVMVGLVEIGPSDKILDLENEQMIDDIGVIWANHVGPEEFAAVLSALRDCEDDSRRNDIIDKLIKKAFQQSHQTRMSEEAWRLEVERRLPEK